jgi:hypothetical protein
MQTVKSSRQIWGRDMQIGAEWDAGVTPPLLPTCPAGRWTVRREAERFTVVFHRFIGGEETILDAFPPTEDGEIAAKTFALTARDTLLISTQKQEN